MSYSMSIFTSGVVSTLLGKLGALKQRRRVKRLTREVVSIAQSPADRLDFLVASYEKFSVELTASERGRMKKAIKTLRRNIRRGAA